MGQLCCYPFTREEEKISKSGCFCAVPESFWSLDSALLECRLQLGEERFISLGCVPFSF